MTKKTNTIDFADSMINSEFRIGVLERIIDHIIQRSPPGLITANDLEVIRKTALSDLQRKYPDAGLITKSG